MPITKEFTILMDDRPGTLGKFCEALADRKVNILAFQSTPFEGKSVVRLVVDNSPIAKTVMNSERLVFTEGEVAYITTDHRPGELARTASSLGKGGINIDHAYSGLEVVTHRPVVYFSVKDVARAASILEQAKAKAA